ncbi:MAG: hypothetical protein M3Q69_02565 [Acidobacteriota bacterium]|nr:hypothetical protein [Acidobacteriota bacterium]
MFRPATILALDDVVMPLAHAVQQRVADRSGLDDLVQARELADDGDVASLLQSIHAQRQRPDSPLRLRDDVGSRELVLLILSAAGPARTRVIELAREIRRVYEHRRFASAFTIELLCLLPEVAASKDYAGAYGLLKALSAEEPKPYDTVWLLDATNANRVNFGALAEQVDSYADAVAGPLLFEPEMSGALPGLRPRGVPPAFSSFGYASLVFPRDAALQRLEPRFTAELIEKVLLSDAANSGVPALLRAKQFVAGDAFALPLARIGVESGQSLFKRFQAKTHVTEQTRSAEEAISAVRRELQVFHDGTHLGNVERLALQREETATELTALVGRTVDETLDREGYAAATALADALIDPLPDLRSDAETSAPRNLATAIHDATATLDERLGFAPNNAASDAARRRVRELDDLLRDQQVVAETLTPIDATSRLDDLRAERHALVRSLPDTLFREEAENNAARNAAREQEQSRLAAEAEAKEQHLRELFAQRPRAEQAVREALEARRSWLWQQVFIAAAAIALIYGVPFVFDALKANLGRVNAFAATILVVHAVFAAFRYATIIAPRVRAAREALARLLSQIETADRAKNAAHADALQFEYDVTHRRAAIEVLRRVRDAAASSLTALRDRAQALRELASSVVLAPIVTRGLELSIVADADIDGWYERTTDERKPFTRDLPIRRSESLHLPFDALRARLTAHSATAFDGFRKLTLADAARTLTTEARLAQRLKRFAETSAPLIELRDDDLPAQQAMQRDLTLWIDDADAPWLTTVQRRLHDAQIKDAPDALSIHAVSRVLHYPGYVLGQFDYYRAEYEAAASREFADAPDLLPNDLALSGPMRAAYEQVVLGRATGVIELRADGQLVSGEAVLGDSHQAAAQRLASTSPDAAMLRQQLASALAPRLQIARDVTRDLQRLVATTSPLSSLDRGVVHSLLERYAEI